MIGLELGTRDRRKKWREYLDSPRSQQASELVIDLKKMKVTVDGKKVDLPVTEFALLRTLVQNKGQVLSAEYLAMQAFQPHFDLALANDKVLWKIMRLRKKIERHPLGPNHIFIVPGEGYRFDP